jgi:hypothetical protein
MYFFYNFQTVIKILLLLTKNYKIIKKFKKELLISFKIITIMDINTYPLYYLNNFKFVRQDLNMSAFY